MDGKDEIFSLSERIFHPEGQRRERAKGEEEEEGECRR